MFIPDDYIRRTSSTIPFGYELDGNFDGYLKPIEEDLQILKEVSEAVFHGEISLGIGTSAGYTDGLLVKPIKLHITSNNGNHKHSVLVSYI